MVANSGRAASSVKAAAAAGGAAGPPLQSLPDRPNSGRRIRRLIDTLVHQTVALNVVRRPKSTPIHELERYMRCKDCSRLQGRPYKRSHLVALRATKITRERSALDVVAGRAVTPNLSTSRPRSILPGGRFWITFSFSECCWGQPCWTVNLNGSVPRFCATWWRRRMTPSSKNAFSFDVEI